MFTNWFGRPRGDPPPPHVFFYGFPFKNVTIENIHDACNTTKMVHDQIDMINSFMPDESLVASKLGVARNIVKKLCFCSE